MRFDILTIFPNLFDSYLNESLIKKSIVKKLNKISVHDLRSWSSGRHKQVDDRPYGGGPGMLLMVEPILKAIKTFKNKNNKSNLKSKIILLSPAGKQFNQQLANKFSKLDQLILICGRYEGVDARIEKFIDEKISVGPYVLSGGELPALIIIETVARLLPGYLGNPQSLSHETFTGQLTDQQEYPQYTRPEILIVNNKKYKVPKILLSGNHQQIEKWHTQQWVQKNKKTKN